MSTELLEDDFGDLDEPRDADERGEGCLFPGQCCMPGDHDRSECHTADMMRDYEREVMDRKIS